MLNHLAYSILSDPASISPASSQRALRLFADYDLSLPRALPLDMLTSVYGWKSQLLNRTLDRLVQLGILVRLTSDPACGAPVYQIAQSYSWTPKSLAQQWTDMATRSERASIAVRA